MAGAYSAAVFIVVPIEDIMATVLYAPVTAIGGENALRIGLLWGLASDAIGQLSGLFAGVFLYGLPFDEEGLPNVGKVKIVVKLGCSPYLTGFNASVLRRSIFDKIWFLAILEEQLKVLKEGRLICLDSEMIMGFAVLDQVVGDLALGKEGIGGDSFAFDINGIE